MEDKKNTRTRTTVTTTNANNKVVQRRAVRAVSQCLQTRQTKFVFETGRQATEQTISHRKRKMDSKLRLKQSIID